MSIPHKDDENESKSPKSSSIFIKEKQGASNSFNCSYDKIPIIQEKVLSNSSLTTLDPLPLSFTQNITRSVTYSLNTLAKAFRSKFHQNKINNSNVSLTISQNIWSKTISI